MQTMARMYLENLNNVVDKMGDESISEKDLCKMLFEMRCPTEVACAVLERELVRNKREILKLQEKLN